MLEPDTNLTSTDPPFASTSSYILFALDMEYRNSWQWRLV